MIVVVSPDPDDSRAHFERVLAGHLVRYVEVGEPAGASPNDVVLVCGTKGLKRLRDAKLVPGNLGIKALRGRRIEGPNGTSILVTNDPFIRLREADKAPELLWDAQLAVRLHDTGSLDPVLGDYRWGTLAEVIEGVTQARVTSYNGEVVLGMDLETMGLYPWYPDRHIVSSQWCWRPGFSIVVPHINPHTLEPEDLHPVERQDAGGIGPVESDLGYLLNEPWIRLWGSNVKGDLEWIAEKAEIECTNLEFDTVVAGGQVDENRSNSLKSHARIYTPLMGGWEIRFEAGGGDIEHMEATLRDKPDVFLEYSGADPDATLQTGKPIRQEMQRWPRMDYFYRRVLHPVSRCFEKVERRGLLADAKAFERLHADLVEDIRKQEETAISLLPTRVQAKHCEKLTLTRDAVIKDAFFSPAGWGLTPRMVTPKGMELARSRTEGKRVRAENLIDYLTPEERFQYASCAAAHLKKFRGNEAAGMFLQHHTAASKGRKALTTYVGSFEDGRWDPDVGFMQYLRPDGHFHPSYILFHGAIFDRADEDEAGAVTGRLAAKGPSTNTIPKHHPWATRIRQCYPAPPGYLFWEKDFKVGELRIIADIGPELKMREAFQRGIDPHVLTAAMTMKMPVEELLSWKKTQKDVYDEKRYRAKSANFGLIFRMSAQGYRTYAEDKYDILMTEQEAKDFHHRFLNEMYPGIPAYHDRIEQEIREKKYIETPLGRIRHLPLVDSPHEQIEAYAIRQGINAPVQCGLNDTALLYLVELEKEFEDEDDVFSVRGSTHDSLYGYVREDLMMESMVRTEEVVAGIPEILAREFGWNLSVDLPMDTLIGPTMGDLEEITVS